MLRMLGGGNQTYRFNNTGVRGAWESFCNVQEEAHMNFVPLQQIRPEASGFLRGGAALVARYMEDCGRWHQWHSCLNHSHELQCNVQ